MLTPWVARCSLALPFGVIIQLDISLSRRDYRCSYNLYFNLFLAFSICFWCKYKAINLIFQTKNTYSGIRKNY